MKTVHGTVLNAQEQVPVLKFKILMFQNWNWNNNLKSYGSRTGNRTIFTKSFSSRTGTGTVIKMVMVLELEL